ncbi:MAG: hypothetical protein JWQ35_1239 [Bacteriovoracaceae bacterium]|nr:hypothetical protein [Bacteriovoracaceae bacterium]
MAVEPDGKSLCINAIKKVESRDSAFGSQSEKLEAIIITRDFIDNRYSYEGDWPFSDEFYERAVARVRSKGGTIMDGGAGGAKVLIGLIANSPKNVRGIAVARKRSPVDMWLGPKRFQYIEGKVEELTLENTGEVDLIIDYLGALGYTEHLDLALQSYLDLMPVGGEIFAYGMTPRIELAPDKFVRINKYLEMSHGFEFIAPEPPSHKPIGAFYLKKTSADAKVAKLRWKKTSSGTPPIVIYEFEDASSADKLLKSGIVIHTY